MLSKNLKYYRLRKGISKAELASQCGVTPMAISHYEQGSRNPSMEILQRLAAALGVRVSDFLVVHSQKLEFSHGEFRKTSSLPKNRQEYIREEAEEYFQRFFSIIEILGGEPLPVPPQCHKLHMTMNPEKDALALRRHLNLAPEGPIEDLIGLLENRGILVMKSSLEDDRFSGMNGLVNGRPYIIYNGNMTTERNRSTIAHELVHLMFAKPDGWESSQEEAAATAVSGAFLFPQVDLIRELGVHRRSVAKDMLLVCREYGISMFLLVKRAQIANVLSEQTAKDFYIRANGYGWKKSEPSRIAAEEPGLFRQLVFRAISEQDINIQRGAELLRMPYQEIVSHCYFNKG